MPNKNRIKIPKPRIVFVEDVNENFENILKDEYGSHAEASIKGDKILFTFQTSDGYHGATVEMDVHEFKKRFDEAYETATRL